MPKMIFVIVFWILWVIPFFVHSPKSKQVAVKKAPKARWGILLQTIGFWSVFIPAGPIWMEPMQLWSTVGATVFGVLGIALAGFGVRHLGKQRRVDAGLNADHEMIVTGPYSIVRHPIYASMLAMFLMTALQIGRLPIWPIGLVFFVIGIEIRVQAEDALLLSRFGATFTAWKARVPAYIPFPR